MYTLFYELHPTKFKELSDAYNFSQFIFHGKGFLCEWLTLQN